MMEASNWWVDEARSEGLRRFIRAQNAHDPAVTEELLAGRKETHWVWFTFPQPPHPAADSYPSRVYALTPAEAIDYWDHPVLRHRLLQKTSYLLAWMATGKRADEILGTIDALKVRSCVELFERVGGHPLIARCREQLETQLEQVSA